MSAERNASSTARSTGRYAVLAVVVWLLAAGAANLTLPQLEHVVETHAHSFIPADSASSVAARRAAELLGVTPSDNLNYLLLERNQPITDEDRRFYGRLITTLRADTHHVGSVTDLWSDRRQRRRPKAMTAKPSRPCCGCPG